MTLDYGQENAIELARSRFCCILGDMELTVSGRWSEPNPVLGPSSKIEWTPPGRTGIQAWIGLVGGKQVASIRRHPAHVGSACTASLDGWVWDNTGNPLGGREAPSKGFPSVPAAKRALAEAVRLHPAQPQIQK